MGQRPMAVDYSHRSPLRPTLTSGILMKQLKVVFFVSCLLYCLCGVICSANERHTSNWAVLVCTSRFWFNYRHQANTLSVYHTVKRLGIPDNQIILMLADDMPCNARNEFAGQVFNSKAHRINLYGEHVEVDYRGAEVSVESFLRVLTDRHYPGTPLSKRLATDERSNVLIYMAGHGGDGFLKFQDTEEVSSHDLADAFEEMRVKGRYHELLFMTDTCQAGSLADEIYSENILAIGSSRVGENSYAHHVDPSLGVAVIDRFTSALLDFFESIPSGGFMPSSSSSSTSSSSFSLAAMLRYFNPQEIRSHPAVRSDLYRRPLHKVPVTDFFGSVLEVQLTQAAYPLHDPEAAAVSPTTPAAAAG